MTTYGPPQRTCIGCGQVRPKAALRRLAVGPDGAVLAQGADGAPGRGAYVCGPRCLSAAARKKSLVRAFRGRAARVDVTALERIISSATVGF